MSLRDARFSEGVPCWNSTGVWAPDGPSCPKLKDCVHCVNCEVYVENGRALFEQEPSLDYLADWAKHLAAAKAEGVGGAQSILVFRLEDEWLAFPTSSFRFVSTVSRLHTIPHKSGELLLGLVNAGDSLQLCFSLKALLGLSASKRPQAAAKDPCCSKAPRFLALEGAGRPWLFQADEILGVFACDSTRVRNTPSTVSRANPNFIAKALEIDGLSVGLLDAELAVFALGRSLQ